MSEYVILKKKTTPTSRVVHISGDIDLEAAEKVIKQLTSIVTKNSEEPITVLLSTYGGDVYAGLSIYDYIKSLPCPVTVVATGPIMSMGTIILLSGDKRVALENTQFMIHQVSTFAIGSLQDINKDLNEGKRMMKIMTDIYVKNTKYTKKQIDAIFKQNEDHYFDAKTALKTGFIHEITAKLELK